MAKSSWLNDKEKQLIKKLFCEVGSAKEVAQLVGREKSTVLKLVRQKQSAPKQLFSWDSFNNSMI